MSQGQPFPGPGTTEYRQAIREGIERSANAWHIYRKMAAGESPLDGVRDKSKAEELMWVHAGSVAGNLSCLLSEPYEPADLAIPHLPELLSFFHEAVIETLGGHPPRFIADRHRAGNDRGLQELNALSIAMTYEELSKKNLPEGERLIEDDTPRETISQAFGITEDTYRHAVKALKEHKPFVEYYWHSGAFRARLADTEPEKRLTYAKSVIAEVGVAYKQRSHARQPKKGKGNGK
jgi:hypothetical protein